MKDEDKVPSWPKEISQVIQHRLIVVYDDSDDEYEIREPATLVDLRRAAEACGYEMAIAGTTQVSSNYVKDVDFLRAERDEWKSRCKNAEANAESAEYWRARTHYAEHCLHKVARQVESLRNLAKAWRTLGWPASAGILEEVADELSIATNGVPNGPTSN